jgi:deoxyadenosine/deoxycytidine kinase
MLLEKKFDLKFYIFFIHYYTMKISIEGSIASGKSTVLTRIQQSTRIPVFLEPIDSWTLLNNFYKNTSRWGFTFNIEVLLSMFKWKNNQYDSLYERSPISCRWVFTQMQYEQGDIIKEEIDLFDKLVETFSWDQDCIIYIKTDPEVCYERMKNRNRTCEEKVPLEYLNNLNKKHNDMIEYIKEMKPNIKIITVDGNKDEDTIYKNILDILKVQLNI